MHEIRNAIGSSAGEGPVSSKTSPARSRSGNAGAAGGSLNGLVIPRAERRSTDQRREDRHRGVVENATIVFRRKKTPVRVINISGGGLMIEADILPRIGEKVVVDFEGFDRVEGIVCWVKQGRIGIDLGDGSIALA